MATITAPRAPVRKLKPKQPLIPPQHDAWGFLGLPFVRLAGLVAVTAGVAM